MVYSQDWTIDRSFSFRICAHLLFWLCNAPLNLNILKFNDTYQWRKRKPTKREMYPCKVSMKLECKPYLSKVSISQAIPFDDPHKTEWTNERNSLLKLHSRNKFFDDKISHRVSVRAVFYWYLVGLHNAQCAVNKKTNKQAVMRLSTGHICKPFSFIAVNAPEVNKRFSLQTICSSSANRIHSIVYNTESVLFVREKGEKYAYLNFDAIFFLSRIVLLSFWLHSLLVASIFRICPNYLHFKP